MKEQTSGDIAGFHTHARRQLEQPFGGALIEFYEVSIGVTIFHDGRP
jgi:hypothetical protein